MWYFFDERRLHLRRLLISYGTIRFSVNHWADPNQVFNSFPGFGHQNLPLAFVSLMTFILIFSSVTMVLAVHEGHKMNRKGVEKYMILTILGGLAFLGCQAWEWTHLLTSEHCHAGRWNLSVVPTTVKMNPGGAHVAHEQIATAHLGHPHEEARGDRGYLAARRKPRGRPQIFYI